MKKWTLKGYYINFRRKNWHIYCILKFNEELIQERQKRTQFISNRYFTIITTFLFKKKTNTVHNGNDPKEQLTKKKNPKQ